MSSPPRIAALVLAVGLIVVACGAPRPSGPCEPILETEAAWPLTRITLAHEEYAGDGVAAMWNFDPGSTGETRIRIRPTNDIPPIPDPNGEPRLVPLPGARHLEILFEGATVGETDSVYSPEIVIQALHFAPTEQGVPRWILGLAPDTCLQLALDRTIPALVLRAYPFTELVSGRPSSRVA